jgi:hypothetical protein
MARKINRRRLRRRGRFNSGMSLSSLSGRRKFGYFGPKGGTYGVIGTTPKSYLHAGILPRGGLPEKLYTVFCYSDSFSLTDTGTAGVAQYWQGRLNSIFDPNYSNNGSNGQPYMRDELVPFYNYAVIYGCSIELCALSGTAATYPHLITVRPTTSASAPTDALLEKERPRS